jgi:hypothetical protein
MAKDKNKKAGSRGKLPKWIAGAKVPKALRKSGAQAMTWAASPTGREVLGGLLVAAAALVAGSKTGRSTVKGSAKEAASAASRVGYALADAAAEVVRRAAAGSDAPAAKPAEPPVKRGKSRPGAPSFTH